MESTVLKYPPCHPHGNSAAECNDAFPNNLCRAVEEGIFPGHAQRNAERLFDLRPEYLQIQTRTTDGIHDTVVNVKPAGHFRRRHRGDAKINGVERADAAGGFQQVVR